MTQLRQPNMRAGAPIRSLANVRAAIVGSRWLQCVHLLVALCAVVLSDACADGGPATAQQVQTNERIAVVDVMVISSNEVAVGSNTFSLAAATNFLATHRGSVDFAAVHSPAMLATSSETTSAAAARLARVGVPLLIVEREGEYKWRGQSNQDGIRTIDLGTDQVAALRRLWKQEATSPANASQPAVQTSLRWDTATGTYHLDRIELGLFGRRVWIMHQQPEVDEESGTIGIELKRDW